MKNTIYVFQNDSDIESIKNALEFHERTKNAFFWNPPTSAAGRRANERKWNDLAINTTVKIDEIARLKKSEKIKPLVLKIEQSYSCSCRNVYRVSTFTINRIKTTSKRIKNILLLIYNTKNELGENL